MRLAPIIAAVCACAHVQQVECADLTPQSAAGLIGKKIALHGHLMAGREGAGRCTPEQIESQKMVLTLVAIDDWPREWDPAVTPLVDDVKALEVVACGVARNDRVRAGFVFALAMDRGCSRALEPLPKP